MNHLIGLLCLLLPDLSRGAFRIVGGGYLDIIYAPYQAKVRNVEAKTMCGGVIISNTSVITAAHCIGNFTSKNQIQVTVGTDKFNATEVPVYAPKEIIIHPKNNKKDNTYDVAIIRLNSSLKYSKSIEAVKLPKTNEDVKNGTVGLVTGWGKTQYSEGTFPPELKFVLMTALSPKDCENEIKKQEPNVSVVIDSIFCATGEKGSPFEGDSGGPFVTQDGVLRGLVSFGFNTNQKESPEIFSKISFFMDFIKGHLD